MVDFVYFYAASTIVRSSPAADIYNPEIQKAACQKVLPIRDGSVSYGPSPYPPFVALLFAPVSRLPFWTAFRLYQAISLALYIAGLILLLRSFFPGQPVLSSLFLPFALAYLPWISNTWLNGQLSPLGFIAMAVALVEQKAGHRFRSGLALSLCLYKPTLLVLLIPMLLYRRQWRELLGLSTGGGVLAGATTVAFGWQIWPAYANLIRSLGDLERARQLTQFVDLAAFFGLLGGSRLAGVLAVLSVACVVPFLAVAWRSYRRNAPLAWAVALSWTLILGPYVPLYDTILIIPSLVASAGELRLGRGDALCLGCFTSGFRMPAGSVPRLRTCPSSSSADSGHRACRGFGQPGACARTNRGEASKGTLQPSVKMPRWNIARRPPKKGAPVERLPRELSRPAQGTSTGERAASKVGACGFDTCVSG